MNWCLFCGGDFIGTDFMVAIPPGATEVEQFLVAHTKCIEKVNGVLRDIFMRDDDH